MRLLPYLLVCSILCACDGPAEPGADASLPDGGMLADGSALDAAVPSDGAAPLADAAPNDAGSTRRVLFVGNSYTYVNDLPAVVVAVAAASGAPVEVESIAEGGARLETHWNTTGARARIESGAHDSVVLQGQSVEPIFGSEQFAYYASLLSDAAQAAGEDVVWFATWARRDGDEIYGPGLPDPAAMTRALDMGYGDAAAPNGDGIARVGAAWQIALTEMPELALHSADGSHPAPEGTLLAACVMVQALTGQTPRVPDPAPLGIAQARAEALCAIAPRVRCGEGLSLCDGACRDTQLDPDHCGGCDMACPGETVCRAGVCGG